MRILKTDFDVSKRTATGLVVVDGPVDLTPLRLAEQSSVFGLGMKLWFITDKEDDELSGSSHYFAVVVTGERFVPVEWNYVATIDTVGGIVAHVFYVPADKISEEEKEMLEDDSKIEGENSEVVDKES